MEELLKYMKALVYLQVQAQAGSGSFGKPELLLHKAGFKPQEIADILGKNKAGVQKAIERSKKGKGAEDD